MTYGEQVLELVKAYYPKAAAEEVSVYLEKDNVEGLVSYLEGLNVFKDAPKELPELIAAAPVANTDEYPPWEEE